MNHEDKENKEAERRHVRLSNMKGIVPSLSGIHYKVHSKRKALSKFKK